jgi:nucleotide-binding universal stress UspA family protein
MQPIFVGVDGSAGAELAVRQAAEPLRVSGATLHLVNAYPRTVRTQDKLDLRRAAEQLLLRTASEIAGRSADVQTHAREGDAVNVIADLAEEEDARLVVFGDRGLSPVTRWLLGSVSDALAHPVPLTSSHAKAARSPGSRRGGGSTTAAFRGKGT